MFDIERQNVYVPESGILFDVAGKIASRGIEIAGAVNPFGGLKLWGNAAIIRSRFVDFDFIDGNGIPESYSGNTPPNVPSFVANAGASYRFDTAWPFELGASLRHVGDRFNFQDNFVTMNAYTLFDAYAFVDIPKTVFTASKKPASRSASRTLPTSSTPSGAIPATPTRSSSAPRAATRSRRRSSGERMEVFRTSAIVEKNFLDILPSVENPHELPAAHFSAIKYHLRGGGE